MALRIATQPNDWWGRPAKEVNADIADWLREETASRGDRPDPQRDIVETLDALLAQQPAPYLFDWRDGRMEVIPPDALPEDGGIAQDYLDETRAKADDLLEALARSNTDPTIARKVGKLRKRALKDVRRELRPELVKGTAKPIIGSGVSVAAAYLFVAHLAPTSGIAKLFPEIDRVVRILEAVKPGEGKPSTPPPGSEPPLNPRTPRPTAERGPTRPT